MLETIIGGLVVAVISGVTVIAWRDPVAYGRLSSYLQLLLLLVWFGIGVWNIAVSESLSQLDHVVKPAGIDVGLAITQVKQRVQVPDLYLLILLGAQAYILVMLFLPKALQRKSGNS